MGQKPRELGGDKDNFSGDEDGMKFKKLWNGVGGDGTGTVTTGMGWGWGQNVVPVQLSISDGACRGSLPP